MQFSFLAMDSSKISRMESGGGGRHDSPGKLERVIVFGLPFTLRLTERQVCEREMEGEGEREEGRKKRKEKKKNGRGFWRRVVRD